MQLVKRKQYPSRHKSGIGLAMEKKYNTTKRKCRGVLKALKKFRYWLYGVRFILETDVRVLLAQLNQSGTDLLGALVTQWIAWIQLFDFEVWHVPGRKHSTADGFYWRPSIATNLAEAEAKTNIDNFILTELNSLWVSPISLDEQIPILADNYSDYSRKIATYLTTLRWPAEINSKKFNAFKKKALKFKVRDNLFFRWNSKNVPMRWVFNDLVERQTILQQLHNESGHKRQKGTYQRVPNRYWWDNLHMEVKSYIRSYKECQRRDLFWSEETLHSTWVAFLW